MFFNIFKSAEEKIKIDMFRYVNDFKDLSFNSNIKGISKNEFIDFCNDSISQKMKYRNFKKNVHSFLVFNRTLIDLSKTVEQLKSKAKSHYLQTEIDLFINSFKTRNELQNTYLKKLAKLSKLEKKEKDLIAKISVFERKIRLFNGFCAPKKVINQVLDINERFDLTEKNIQRIDSYLDFQKKIEPFEKCQLKPNIANLKDLKEKWKAIIASNTYSNFSLTLKNDFNLQKNDLLKFIDHHALVSNEKQQLHEMLNNIEVSLKLNILCSQIFNHQLAKLQNNLKSINANYQNEKELIETILNDYSLLKSDIFVLSNKIEQLLAPVTQAIKQLKIEKPELIEDLSDYYVYSLSKRIEQKLAKYGTSKNINQSDVQKFITLIEKNLYTLTKDQLNAINKSVVLLNQKSPASCLIQGDVSCGKTIVTAVLMFLVALKKIKAVYIVPRKTLRIQHLQTLQEYNKLFNLNLKICDATTTDNLKDADIVLNGYSFADSKFQEIDFGLGIIDEIQLFGVEQRNNVQNRYPNIDMFYTTATPHPRTKLITLLGNMEIIEIRQLPPNRKLKKTEAFTTLTSYHESIIKAEIAKQQMILVVCPLVNKEGVGNFESVKIAKLHYQKLFSHLKLETLTGTMGDDKKTEIITKCIEGKVDMLISSKSIEVGINIPNASVIIIHYPYSTFSWGVSQLHQLRGRVGRNNQDSYCFIESPQAFDENSPIGSVLRTQDVFELTASDFNWRGFEKIIGTAQAGKNVSQKDQELKIKGYEIIANHTSKTLNLLSQESISIIKTYLNSQKIENIN